AEVFALPGNHDDAGNVAACFGETVTTSVAGWSIVALETTRPGQVNGGVDLTDALTRIDACAGSSTIVVMHHPPVSLSTHQFFRFEGAPQFLTDLTDRPHVRVVLSGHLHSAFDLGVEGLRLLGCPSTLYGISHHGSTYTITRDDGIGARLIGLGDDGSVTTTLV
ncbi:MAG: metallophosphoesterase, partial [Acidimicrobiia bacterium]